jgi:hypothetical protein
MLEFLTTVPYLGMMSKTTLMRAQHRMKRVEYLRVNEVVIQEGQIANCVILIKEG